MWTPLANAAQSGDDRPPPISAAPGSPPDPRARPASRSPAPARAGPPRRTRRRRSAGASPRRRPPRGGLRTGSTSAKSARRSASVSGIVGPSRVRVAPDHRRRTTGHDQGASPQARPCDRPRFVPARRRRPSSQRDYRIRTATIPVILGRSRGRAVRRQETGDRRQETGDRRKDQTTDRLSFSSINGADERNHGLVRRGGGHDSGCRTMRHPREWLRFARAARLMPGCRTMRHPRNGFVSRERRGSCPGCRTMRHPGTCLVVFRAGRILSRCAARCARLWFRNR